MQIFIKKAGVTIDLDETKTEQYNAGAMARGWKERLQDSVAAAKTEDEAKGMLGKFVDAILAGEYNPHMRVGVARDPVGKEAARLARAKGVKKDAIEAYLTAHPEVVAMAQRNVAEAGELPDA